MCRLAGIPGTVALFLLAMGVVAPHPECLAAEGGAVHPALAMKPVPEGLGVNIHFYKGNDNDLAMLAEAGVGIVRMDISWAGAEKEAGKYDFAHYDQLISDLEARNIRVLFIIDYGNPLYDGGESPRSDECRAAYAQFCAALAGRYAGKAIIWELWNEPNIGFWKPSPNVNDYMAWCHAVVPAIRAADPNACIIAPATSGIDLVFIERCLSQGLLKLVDGISVHPYRSPSQGPETAVPEYRKLRQMIERYRAEDRIERAIPILSGEWGYTTTDMPREQQGRFLPRQWLTNMAEGVPVSIWYDWHDDGQDPKEREHNFGTVTWDYQPKPAFMAMKTLVSVLRGYTPVGWLPAPDDKDFIAAFRREGAYILAAWTADEPHPLTLGPGVRIASVTGQFGEPASPSADGTVSVSDGPVYVSLADPVPAWLAALPVVTETSLSESEDGRQEIAVRAMFTNESSAEFAATPQPVSSEYVEGEWESAETRKVGPGETATAVWRGVLARRDIASMDLAVPFEVAADGQEPVRIEGAATLSAPNILELKLAWSQRGLLVRIASPGRAPFTGRLVAEVGDAKSEVPVAVGPYGTSEFTVPGVSLADGPRAVGLRLFDSHGWLAAAVEPMTYALVDAMDFPVGTDASEHLRLWSEGDADRKIDLSAQVIESPGDDPPFPKAVEVTYDIAPGWCFWQVGPKEQSLMPTPQPKKIMVWVHADGSDDAVLCRVADETGQTFQTGAGNTDFYGWRVMEMRLEGPMGHWGGANDGEIHPPLKWTSYYLQDPHRDASKGTTCVTGVVVAW